MKHFVLIILIALNFNAFSQVADKTVTLVVSGSGKTQDEAKQNALRSAIEQAFGTFISSKTEILNDNLVKDEIVSVANGNIQKFEIISEVQIPEVGYAITLNATVSVTKLTSFVESKGVIVEFKGDIFTTNAKIQDLYKKNEFKSVVNIIQSNYELFKKSFDFKLNVSEPIKNNNNYEINLIVDVTQNENYNLASKYFINSIKSLSLSKEEIDNYNKINLQVYPFCLINEEGKSMIIYFRNKNSLDATLLFGAYLNAYCSHFYITFAKDTILVANNRRDYNMHGSMTSIKPFIFSSKENTINKNLFPSENLRNTWYLFSGKSDLNVERFTFKNYNKVSTFMVHSNNRYFTDEYCSGGNNYRFMFPLMRAIDDFCPAGLLSLYNPLKDKYITSHTYILSLPIDVIEKIDSFKLEAVK